MTDETNQKIERTASGLRDALFDVLEGLRSGDISHQQARAAAAVAKEIVHSVEVQVEFEKDKQRDKVPAHLPEMHLVPPLRKVKKLETG